MNNSKQHPLQPIIVDPEGVIRFKENKIVSFLLNSNRPTDLNELALMPFSDEDREQFAQLIGYSVSGFGELSYVKKETVKKADAIAREIYDVQKSTNQKTNKTST